MNKQILKIAAEQSEFVYQDHTSVKTTQFLLTDHGHFQCVAVAGTNGVLDWFWNVLLISKNGVKLSGAVSAARILNSPEYITWRDVTKPLISTGHSKGAGPALELRRIGISDHCVAFCPPPYYRRPVPHLKNTLIVIDEDDIVPWLGRLGFAQPQCEHMILARNQKKWRILRRLKDHSMASIRRALNV